MHSLQYHNLEHIHTLCKKIKPFWNLTFLAQFKFDIFFWKEKFVERARYKWVYTRSSESWAHNFVKSYFCQQTQLFNTVNKHVDRVEIFSDYFFLIISSNIWKWPPVLFLKRTCGLCKMPNPWPQFNPCTWFVFLKI